MSGLFGYLGDAGPEPISVVVQRMGERMRHRPYYVVESASPEPRVGLGRLGIGIFNRAPQPVRGADGQVWLWLCGELYHQQTRRAALARAGAIRPEADDAELALQVYLREGTDGLTRLEGSFALAVWDGRSAELLLVNDRFGSYPHFYARPGGGFAFAPEIKGVLAAPGVPRQLDLTAVAEHLRFQQLLGERTWLEDVRYLRPASVLRYRLSDGQLSLQRYWDWDAIGSEPWTSFGQAVEECSRLFQHALDARTTGPYRLGIYLSGGVDGRMILGFLAGRVPLTTLTYGAPGCRDVVYATELAQRTRTEHHWFPFHDGRWVEQYAPLHLALTEAMQNWVHAHGISTLDRARQLIEVNLSGLGGGLIPGYWRNRERSGYGTTQEADLLQRMYEHFCTRNQWPGLTEAEAETLLTGRGDRRLRGLAFDSLRQELARTAHHSPDGRADYFIKEQHGIRTNAYLVVFARLAFEGRCPYFDYDLVDFVYSLPRELRLQPHLRRAMLTRQAPHLARVPYERDDRLPHSNPLVFQAHATLQRVKGRVNRHLVPVFADYATLYADYEQWLRTDLRAWAEGILFDRRTLERGLFDPDATRALWERHLRGTELWTIGKLAPLMTIELILRHLVDGDDWPEPPTSVPCSS